MTELLGLVGLFLFGAIYWQFRRQSEFAQLWLTRYCQQQDFQLLSVYRYRFMWKKGRVLTQFRFEFSHDGLQHNEGKLWLHHLRVLKVELPILREPANPSL
ncbi:DUF3301 domain-containing protein [Oceanisphaera avium]|uniref:DUF3301 domain-containing protein n=1 Tax=Oceanisphaera avium TaxID=1903694 RepID=A0A1Y0CXK1_9GAMM|nr:DUF3301 domain-containing protein [Oceanisphaera avium]ART79637.1 hypothetical protein CBP12_05285 [Oceanisphaera avium]